MLTRKRPSLGQLEREVDLVEVHLALRADRPSSSSCAIASVSVVGEHLVAELDQVPVEAVERQVADLEVDVGRTLLEAEAQEAVELLPIHRFRTLRGDSPDAVRAPHGYRRIPSRLDPEPACAFAARARAASRAASGRDSTCRPSGIAVRAATRSARLGRGDPRRRCAAVARSAAARPRSRRRGRGARAGARATARPQPAPPVGLRRAVPAARTTAARSPRRAPRSTASAGRSDSRRCAAISTARARRARQGADRASRRSRTRPTNWQMAAPGAQPTAENSPVSYKLRQDIRQLSRRGGARRAPAARARGGGEPGGRARRVAAARARRTPRRQPCGELASVSRSRRLDPARRAREERERGQRERGGEREVAGIADRLGDPARCASRAACPTDA